MSDSAKKTSAGRRIRKKSQIFHDQRRESCLSNKSERRDPKKKSKQLVLSIIAAGYSITNRYFEIFFRGILSYNHTFSGIYRVCRISLHKHVSLRRQRGIAITCFVITNRPLQDEAALLNPELHKRQYSIADRKNTCIRNRIHRGDLDSFLRCFSLPNRLNASGLVPSRSRRLNCCIEWEPDHPEMSIFLSTVRHILSDRD